VSELSTTNPSRVSAIRVEGRELGFGQVAARSVVAAEILGDLGVLQRLRERRDAQTRRWVVLTTQRDDISGQVKEQTVTTAWLAGWLAGWSRVRPRGRLTARPQLRRPAHSCETDKPDGTS
jgi:hypothetical protein